jgi:hypothetical protein
VCRSSFFLRIFREFAHEVVCRPPIDAGYFMISPKSQLRRHARVPFKARMQVSWKDSHSQVQNQPATCLDLSAEGARLETDAPIPVRAVITLYSTRYGSLGTASVRHCVRHTLNYSIGVEFTSLRALAGQGRQSCLEEIQLPAEGQP